MKMKKPATRYPEQRWLNKHQLCAYVNLSYTTVLKYMRREEDPFPVARDTGGQNVWDRELIDAWMESLPIRDVNDPMARAKARRMVAHRLDRRPAVAPEPAAPAKPAAPVKRRLVPGKVREAERRAG